MGFADGVTRLCTNGSKRRSPRRWGETRLVALIDEVEAQD
jgi:hypothetical protein